MVNALQIRNATKSFSDFTLDKVSFNVPRGSIMGLIGENGAGKSTTINLILNLLKMDSGEIEVFGVNAIKKEKEIKSRVAVIFDSPLLIESFNSKDMEKIMSKSYPNWNSEQFKHLCNRFELPMKKKIKEFSRGMKVKLNFALALSCSPELLILDEATAGLDPIVRDEILDILLEFIQDENRSILFSSHITSDLDKIADYITFIHKGRVLLSESKDTLLYEYGIIKCGDKEYTSIDKNDILAYRRQDYEYQVLVRNKALMMKKYKNMVMDNTTIESIMLLYGRGKRTWKD